MVLCKKNRLDSLAGNEFHQGIVAKVHTYDYYDFEQAINDAEGKENLISLLKTLYNEGISIILITHDMDVVYSCCETVIEMKDGNIVSNKETYEFFYEKKNDSTYVIPEIFKFCRVFEKESIKKCRNMNELLEALSNEWFCLR